MNQPIGSAHTAQARLTRIVEEDGRRTAFRPCPSAPVHTPTPLSQTRAALTGIVAALGYGALFEALAEVLEQASAGNPEHSRESLALMRAGLQTEQAGVALCRALGLS